jgi:hypothetical protein
MYSVLTDGSGAQVAKVTINYDPATQAVTSIAAENDTDARLPVLITRNTGAVVSASLAKGTKTYTGATLTGWGVTDLTSLNGVSISTPS